MPTRRTRRRALEGASRGATPKMLPKELTHGYDGRDKKTTRKDKVGRRIVLPARQYDKLERLVFWYESTPDEIDLGEHTWDRIDEMVYGLLDKHLSKLETATVEIGKYDLIAVVADDGGNETRVPVLRRGELQLNGRVKR